MLDSPLAPSLTAGVPDRLDIPVLYTPSLTKYTRRKTSIVTISDVPMGSDYPIRVQSMTTIDTMDTAGSVEQSIRMIEAGCEYIRITAPSVKEAQNLENIRKELRARGYTTPLIADIHFTPNAAELAARIVEKVRINPGNYADRKRFEFIDYTDAAYAAELERIRAKFLPLVRICKEYGTAMRIGTNHGSLSDRILSRYGDTPVGMVESALEFLQDLRRRAVLQYCAVDEVEQSASDGAGVSFAGATPGRRGTETVSAAPRCDRSGRGRRWPD